MLPLKPVGAEVLQVNIGKMCNQTCAHCHVDAGPDRREIMSKETMQQILSAIDRCRDFKTVDITGGAPEMNPNFRWFVSEIRKRNIHVIVRCNLTIILAHEKYNDLPLFFKENKIEVVSSLPHYTSLRTDKQRGKGVFDQSIQALRMLNEVGYAVEGSGLILNLVYNPAGAFLPGDQQALESDYKRKLKSDYGIVFNSLFCITNMPISRYLEYLLASNNLESYMQTLIEAFNPAAVAGVMCRNMVSVGWDGSIYDCDFNQMLDLKVKGSNAHISTFQTETFKSRDIIIHQHCYGCTAGSGSSCGGVTS